MSEESTVKTHKINEVESNLAITVALITLVGVFIVTYALV